MRSLNFLLYISYILHWTLTFPTINQVYGTDIEIASIDTIAEEGDATVLKAHVVDQADDALEDENILQSTMIRVNEAMLRGFFSEAETILLQLIQSHPSYVDAYIQLGRVKANLGNINEAKELYNYIINYLDQRYPPVYLALGKLSLFEQDYINAEELFRMSWSHHLVRFEEKQRLEELNENETNEFQNFERPFLIDYNLSMGKLSLAKYNAEKQHQNQKEDSIKPEQESNISSSGTDANSRKSTPYENFLNEAIQYLSKCLSLDPTNEQALFDKGVSLLLKDSFEEAVTSFNTAIKHNPSINYFILGNVYKSYSLYFHALAMYKRALELTQTSKDRYTSFQIIEIMFSIAQCYELLPTIFYRPELLVSLPTIDDDDDSDVYTSYYYSHTNSNQTSLLYNPTKCQEKAILFYEKVIQLNEDTGRQKLGMFNVDQAKIEKSVALAHLSLGSLYTGTGLTNFAATNACGLNHELAIYHFQKALSLDNDLDIAHDQLNFCMKEIQEMDEWAFRIQDLQNRIGSNDEKDDRKIELSQSISIIQETRVPFNKKLHYQFNRFVQFFQGKLSLYMDRISRILTRLYQTTMDKGHLLTFLHGKEMLSYYQNTFTPSLKVNRSDDNEEKGDIDNLINHIGKNNSAIDNLGEMDKIYVENFTLYKEPSSSSHTLYPSSSWISMQEKQRKVNYLSSLDFNDIPSEEYFIENYALTSIPIIINNFQSNFAPSINFQNDALNSKFADMLVRVSLSEDGRFDGPESGVLWGLPQRKGTGKEKEVLVRPPQTTMKFQDFLKLLQLGKQSREQGLDLLKETFYLEYLSVTQYLGKSFTEMINLPTILQQNLQERNVTDAQLSTLENKIHNNKRLEPVLTNIWMGKGNTTSPLHYDDYENFLCQIRGQKELVLFPPNDLDYLSYVGRRKGLLSYTYPNIFNREAIIPSNYSVVFGSSVRVSDPYKDVLDTYPSINATTPFRVTLKEGQTLFMPAYWHHEVTSFPDDGGVNLAVNFWYRNVTRFDAEEKLFV